MKPRTWAAVVMFVSSYSPLALILAIKDYDAKARSLQNPRTCVGILLLSAASVLLLWLAMQSIRLGCPVTIKRISNRSGELVNYTIPYMISFFGFSLGNWQDLVSFAVFMVLMCFLTIRTQSIFINPLLALMGYGLYDIEFDENGRSKQGIFLCRDELRIGDECLVQRLTPFQYCVTEIKRKDT